MEGPEHRVIINKFLGTTKNNYGHRSSISIEGLGATVSNNNLNAGMKNKNNFIINGFQNRISSSTKNLLNSIDSRDLNNSKEKLSQFMSIMDLSPSKNSSTVL